MDGFQQNPYIYISTTWRESTAWKGENKGINYQD